MDLIPPLEGRPLWNLRPDAIRQHSREPSHRKGSDLNDMHLLCLASYAAVTYVDKRTMENVRRAGGKVPALIKQIGAVLKARHYTEILDDIALLDNVHEGVQNFV